jgi:uncharacterized protein (TIGR02453 family)
VKPKTSVDVEPSFAGFSKAGLTFLAGLARHNERDWFNARKSIYLTELDAPFKALMADVNRLCKDAGLTLSTDPRRPTFRIYRDVRFSLDKRPYKTSLASALHPQGERSTPGAGYVSIDTREPFVAAAFYHPEPAVLLALRTAIAKKSPAFGKLLGALKQKDLVLESDESLMRLPAGFKEFAGTSAEPYLKFKSLMVRRPISRDALTTPQLAEEIALFLADAMPLLTWGWKAIA